jgi:hypothetical protein
MDTKTPTPSTDIILDHPIPIHSLQTTVLHLTEQVKQLQRELGVQISKFNSRVRPIETFLAKKEKEKQKFEEVRKGLNLGRCGTGTMMLEQKKRKKEKEKEIDELWRGFGMFGTGRGRRWRAVEKNGPAVIVCRDPGRVGVENDKLDVEGKEEGGEPSRARREGEEEEKGNMPGRVSGSRQALHEALEKQK